MSPRYCFEPTGTVSEKGGPMIKHHESSFDGSTQPYALYVPASYTPDRKWPLVISLHGYSSDHVLNLRRAFGLGNRPGEDGEVCKKCFPPFPEVEFIVASPYAFGSCGYAAMSEVEVLDVLNEVKRDYSIDDDRIYLTGLSMGGEGTWHFAVRYPHIWASIAPVCAPTSLFIGPEDVSGFTENLLHVPAFISHGSADPVVPVECSHRMLALLEQSGYSVEYKEYPRVEHDAWNHTYADARIFDWFRPFTRRSKPEHIVYVTDCLHYSQAYWVEITRILDWAARSRIEVKIAGDNIIEVTAANIGAFTLDLANVPVNLSNETTVRCNGEEVFVSSVPKPAKIEIELHPAPAGPLIKRKGLEGPVYDAFRSRFVIVRGTSVGDAGILSAIEDTAHRVACWTEWMDVDIPIFPDKGLTEDAVRSSNLVLVGDDRTNDVIRRINGELPVRFTEDGVQVGSRRLAGDLGIVEIYPNPLNQDKYVVLLGGRSPEILAKAIEAYRNMPDCGVISRDTNPSVAETYPAYGYFDASWQLDG